MSLSDLASLGSFVSGVAVLISLIYVGYQVRQASKHQRSLMMQGRASRVMNVQLSLADPTLAPVWNKMLDRPETLSDLELRQAGSIAAVFFASLEETWLEGRESLQSKAVHETTERRIAWLLSVPFLRAYWPSVRRESIFEPVFAELVDRVFLLTQANPLSIDGFRQALGFETTKPIAAQA
jgi:hypothetical protein